MWQCVCDCTEGKVSMQSCNCLILANFGRSVLFFCHQLHAGKHLVLHIADFTCIHWMSGSSFHFGQSFEKAVSCHSFWLENNQLHHGQSQHIKSCKTGTHRSKWCDLMLTVKVRQRRIDEKGHWLADTWPEFWKNKLRKRVPVGTDFQSLFEVDSGQL